MAHAFSATEDVSFYTRYGQGTALLDPASHPLRNSLIAAAAAFAFCGMAIAHGIGNLPPVEAVTPGSSSASFAANDPLNRLPLETLPPEIAAQARMQPVHTSTTVVNADIPAALYAPPVDDGLATVDSDTPSTDPATVDTDAQDTDAVVDDLQAMEPPEPEPEPQTTDSL